MSSEYQSPYDVSIKFVNALCARSDMRDLLADAIINAANAQKPDLMESCCKSSLQFTVVEMITHSDLVDKEWLREFRGKLPIIDFNQVFEHFVRETGICRVQIEDKDGSSSSFLTRDATEDIKKTYLAECEERGLDPIDQQTLEERCREMETSRNATFEDGKGQQPVLAVKVAPLANEAMSCTHDKESCAADEDDDSPRPRM